MASTARFSTITINLAIEAQHDLQNAAKTFESAALALRGYAAELRVDDSAALHLVNTGITADCVRVAVAALHARGAAAALETAARLVSDAGAK